jgi:glutathione S-transferase
VIDLYTWTTPNGRKASIALEELAIPYEAHAVDIGKDEQFKPEFLKISPNNRIPAIVDRDNGFSLMEIYLADMAGKLLPAEKFKRMRVIEWLMWQMGGVGPMLGQAHHFLKYNRGMNIPSPTSRPGRGSRATNGRPSTSTPIRTSSGGTSPSPSGPQCRRAMTCRRRWRTFRCRKGAGAALSRPACGW